MFRLVIKPPVYQMLDDAYWWYEQQLPGLGERLLKEIDACFDKLRHTPFYYSIANENYRQIMLKYFPYKIIFEIINDEVIIYTVFHTSKNPDKLFD
jgi:hypothetical protein